MFAFVHASAQKTVFARLCDADGEVHHAAARGGAAHTEGAVGAGMSVGHEGGAVLGAGSHGAYGAALAKQGIVKVLDVGA